MSIIVSLNLFALLISLSFWIFLLIRKEKNKISKILEWMFFLIFFWIFFDLLGDIRIFSDHIILLFWKISSVVSLFLSALVLYFVIKLINKKINGIIFYSFLTFLIILSPIYIFTDKIIYVIDPSVYWWGLPRFSPGKLFFISVLFIGLPLFLSLYLSVREYFKLKSGVIKNQLKFVIAGLSIPIVLGVLTDLILPFLGINFIPLAEFLIIFTILFFFYAIYKWNAMGVSLESLRIKNKILIPVLLATFLLSITSGIIFYKFSSDYIEEEFNNSLEAITFLEVERVRNYMNNRKDDAVSLASSPWVKDFLNSEYHKNINEIISDINEIALSVSIEISEYLKNNPQAGLIDLQKDPEFQEIAVQPVGKTGYTAVTDYNSMIARFHKNPSTIDFDLHLLADKLPGFWSVMSKTEGGQRAEGFYDWLEPDGSKAQKYMDIEIVDRRTADGVGLSVAATTYVDEYGYDLSKYRENLDYLKDFNDIHNYSDLLIINKQGDIIFSTKNKIKYGENLNNFSLKGSNLQLVFANISGGNNFAFSDEVTFPDNVINKSPYIASVIYDSNSDDFLGILALEIDLDKISDLFYKIETERGFDTRDIYLVGSDSIIRATSGLDGGVIVSNKMETENLRKCLSHNYLSEDERIKAHGEIFEFENIKKELSLGNHAYIPEYDWCLLVEANKKEVTGSVSQLAAIFLLSGALYFIIFYLIISFIAKKISKPINNLQFEIEEIKKGDLDRTIKIVSKDEIGQLSQNFNEMILAIKKSRQELNARVKKQTREIIDNAQDLDNQQSAILNILEDVEEEKDNTLEEKEKIYTILHSIGDGVFVVDRNLKIIMINHMVEKITSFASGELVGRKYSDVLKFIREVDKKKMESDFIEDAMRSESIQKMPSNTMLVKKDGDIIPVADSVAPLRDKNKKVVGGVIVFRDITKEHQIDKAKTEFVSLASHQLRTPLSAINWYAEMLLSGDAGKLNKEQSSFVNEIYVGNQRMVELVNALLNVSRIELGTLAIDPKPTDFREISKTIIKELQNEIIAKKIKIKESYARNLPIIKADPNLSRIIVQNIITNAVKYTPNEGKIDISLEKEKQNLLIKISDTGYGIPKDQQDKIFQKLFRADNVREKDTGGTGLGLYLVKSILEQSGGEISFESIKNKGTTFFVRIPLSGMKKKEGSKTLN